LIVSLLSWVAARQPFTVLITTSVLTRKTLIKNAPVQHCGMLKISLDWDK